MLDGERIRFRGGPLDGSGVDWDGGDFYEIPLADTTAHEAAKHLYRRNPEQRDTFEWQGVAV